MDLRSSALDGFGLNRRFRNAQTGPSSASKPSLLNVTGTRRRFIAKAYGWSTSLGRCYAAVTTVTMALLHRLG
jgi:hypothetical protein